MQLFHNLLDSTTVRRRDHEVLRYQGAGITYLSLRANTLRTAAGLAALGLRKGDRVAILLGNRPEAVELAFAASRLGLIFVILSPMLRTRQLAHALVDCGARSLVISEALLPMALSAADASSSLQSLVLVDTDKPPRPLRPGLPYVTLDDLRSYPPLAQAAQSIDRDPAAILYTSGSTGRPKGVTLSHLNLVSGAQIVAGYLDYQETDRILAALPLSFDYGLSQVSTAIFSGACVVLTSFSTPTALLNELASENITGLAGVPTMWTHLASATWPAAVRQRLRFITNSGGALHLSVIQRLRGVLPHTRLFCMYGLTEAFRSTYLDPRDLDRKSGSIGRPIANQEILVLRNDGSRCDPDEPGELVHRGSLVTLGYWNDPEASALRYRPAPSWAVAGFKGEMAVWSGDVVRMDAEGYLYFVGRSDAQIKTSGYRVNPGEIEEVVAELPDVVECCALGLPDAVLGQRIVLAVVAAEGQAEAEIVAGIRKQCRVQLPAYLMPTETRTFTSLPRNANGKTDRAALAAEWSQHAAP